MLQEPANELFGGDGAELDLVGGRFFVVESDLAVLELEDAVVADGDAEDVRGEVFECCLAAADGLGVDHPGFRPDSLIHLIEQPGLFQLVSELGAEERALTGRRKSGREEFHFPSSVSPPPVTM